MDFDVEVAQVILVRHGTDAGNTAAEKCQGKLPSPSSKGEPTARP